MKYRMRGKRFLKKYTAAFATPAYAVAADAQAAVDGLCDAPWQEVDDAIAQMAYHTSEIVDSATQTTGLDMNVAIRNRLDAALWCADHKGGRHRAYANAACYVFELPEMETYPNLISLTARVTSDPYNSTGVRLAVHLSDTLDIPVNCAEAREGAVHVEGVAPREARTGTNGKTYWYGVTEKVSIAVETLPMKKYLLLVVGLENYNVSRGDWLEGSAYIHPTVTIETDGELTGWTEGVVEAASSGVEFVVRNAGADWEYTDEQMPSGFTRGDGFYGSITEHGKVHPFIASDMYSPGWRRDKSGVSEDGSTWESTVLSPRDPTKCASGGVLTGYSRTRGGIHECYAAFYADKMYPVRLGTYNNSFYYTGGAGFAVGRKGNSNAGACYYIIRKKGLVPFCLPEGFAARKIRLDRFMDERLVSDYDIKVRKNVWLARNSRNDMYSDPVLQRHELFTATRNTVGDYELIATFEHLRNDTEGADEADIDLKGVGPHTLLLTMFIDQTDLDLDSQEEQEKGDGYTEPTVRDIDDILGLSGAISGGWSPRITLIG